MPLDGDGRAVTPALGVKAPDRQPMRNGQSRALRSTVSEARKPLALPTPTPVPRAAAAGERGGKRRVAREVDDELSPAEQALQMTKEQLARHLSRADDKVEIAEAWRKVGHELLQAARRHFRAHKAHGLISQSAFNLQPVELDFAKKLFMGSLSSMPVLKKASDKPSKGLTITHSYQSNGKLPKKPKCDVERPGFSAFVESLKCAAEGVLSKEAQAGAANSGQEAEEGMAVQEGGKGKEGEEGGEGEQKRRISKVEQRRLWDELEEEAKTDFARAEEERVREYEAALEAEQAAQDNPKAVTVTVRDGEAMRKLLRITSPQIQGFEYVSIAGHQVQQAVFEKLILQYDVEKQHLKLRAFVGHLADAPATSLARA